MRASGDAVSILRLQLRHKELISVLVAFPSGSLGCGLRLGVGDANGKLRGTPEVYMTVPQSSSFSSPFHIRLGFLSPFFLTVTFLCHDLGVLQVDLSSTCLCTTTLHIIHPEKPDFRLLRVRKSYHFTLETAIVLKLLNCVLLKDSARYPEE